MSGIGLSATRVNDYGTSYQSTGTVKTPEKSNQADNVVNVTAKGSFSKEDFVAAKENAKNGVMFIKNEGGEIYKIDINTNKEFINDALAKLDKKENFSLKLDLGDFKTKDIAGFCKDYQSKASGDAKAGTDPQYKALAADSNNYLKVDQATGNITGYHNSTLGKESPLPEGMPTNIKDVIKQDFARYGAEMTKKFPNNEAGAKNFLEALKTIPGNSDNKNLNLENAKDLLSYIHTGANTDKGSNVKELQCLLRGMTGTKGVDISDKNNPTNGDDRYGYATTLQVRSLDAFLAKNTTTPPKEMTPVYKPEILNGNPVFLIDRSSSMNLEKASLATTVGNFLQGGGNYRIATYQDSQGDKDIKWANNSQNTLTATEAKNILSDTKNALYATTSGMGMQESGITNSLNVLKKLPDNTGKPKENMIMFTDEPDTLVRNQGMNSGPSGKTGAQQAEAKLDQLVNDANAKNYKPVVVFHDDQNDKYVAVDLSTLKDKLKEKNIPFSAVLSDRNDNSSNNTVLDFTKVASKLGLQWQTDMKNLKF